ncbi:MAG: chromosomal replication initiator protein DnaA [Athalassotoga sp.]|uniref:chromosomal replication initiator protein DnaA n=1 Tax=Athalassotoga sp. TaxID=2022597 RepID=UPI0026D6D4CB
MDVKAEIINSLKSKISRKIWEMWFSTFKVESVKDDLITFSVGNLFIKDWISQRYARQFSESIKEIIGHDVPYQIKDEVVEDSQTKQNIPLVRKRPLLLSEFNKEYTFESFVVGPFNEEGYDGAIEVAKNPGKMNPFFLYGGVGLGKTHLLNAIGNYLLENEPDLHVMYMTAEKFMNDLVVSIKNGSTIDFRKNLREKLDVLMIDDIQILEGKEGIQSELFHTLNHFIDNQRQIILCSDRTPVQLSQFQPRLVSRLQMGLMVKIDNPDLKTKFEIAKTFAAKNSIPLDDQMLREIVNASDNIRTLKGIINKIAFKSSKIAVNESEISKIVKEIAGVQIKDFEGEKTVEKEIFFNALSMIFDIRPAEIDAKLRTAKLSNARQIGMFFARKYLGKTFAEIGEWFGRDHSSVVYACKKVEESVRLDNAMVKKVILQLQEILKINTKESAM